MPTSPLGSDDVRVLTELLTDAHQRIRALEAQLRGMAAALVAEDGLDSGMRPRARRSRLQHNRAPVRTRASRPAIRPGRHA